MSLALPKHGYTPSVKNEKVALVQLGQIVSMTQIERTLQGATRYSRALQSPLGVAVVQI